jgi:hypothetical protein
MSTAPAHSWSVDPGDEGWTWRATVGRHTLTGISDTRTQARDDAVEAIERLAEIGDQGLCLVCRQRPRRLRSATCGEPCAKRLRRFLRLQFAHVHELAGDPR